MAPRSGPVIGIDLGRAHSRGAYRDSLDDRVVVFAAVPSYVAFVHGRNDSPPLVGYAAKDQALHDSKNTVFDARQLLGRTFADIASRLDQWPFTVVDRQGKPAVQVTVDGHVALFAPEDILASVLGKIKETAAAHLGKTVERAVITVPAYFNDDQRQATKDAAGLAGLHCERIVNEPTAAAMAYGLDKTQADGFFVVCHVGTGTFDISVLAVEEGIFEIVATSGKDLREEDLGARDLCETLSKDNFEELDSTSCKFIRKHVESVLKEARVSKSQINDLLIFGGSVHIPRVVQLIERFFDNKQALSGIDPEEVVARGAAIQGSVFEAGLSTFEIMCCYVVILTVGIETPGGVMAPVLQRNCFLPARKSAVFTTNSDGQSSFLIRIFEGERVLTRDNQFVGEFELTGLTPGPRGKQIEVTVEMDEDETTKVTATEKETGRHASFTAKLYHTDSDRLQRIFKQVEECAETDAVLRDALAAKALFESYAGEVQAELKKNPPFGAVVSVDGFERMAAATKIALEWVDAHRQSVTVSREQVAEVRAELEAAVFNAGVRVTDGL
ncbi:ATPase with role in protein import into the ER [Geranomyces variabilis]|nr:ATPase with role in protein import into the ER [Geranomyces variabilis]